ncbi:MAG: hypothetical protein WCA84_13820 [Ignavibacteriaceae bacterium]
MNGYTLLFGKTSRIDRIPTGITVGIILFRLDGIKYNILSGQESFD